LKANWNEEKPLPHQSIRTEQAQDAKIASVDKYARVELARKRGWMETQSS